MGQYKKIWSKLELQLFQKLVTEPIKREDRCVYGKLKTWKECIKTNFHGEDVTCDMYCNATAVLNIGFIYKQGKIILRCMLKRVNIPMQKTSNATC